MTTKKNNWPKRLIAFFVLFSSLATGGCMAREMTVDVVVLNYNPQPVTEFTIQGKYIGGYYGGYGPGGTGGKIYCCIEVRPGEALVEWMYGGAEGSPKAGLKSKSSGVIPKPSGDYKYLGVHIYPDEKVEFTLTRDIPPEKKEGAP